MIVKIAGKLEQVSPVSVVIQAQGISYEVQTSLQVLQLFQDKINQEVELPLRHIFSDAGQQLYGFANNDERVLFDFLRSLPGLGPSISLNIISTLSTESLVEILRQEHSKALTRVPGIGKTKSEKIIFEARQRRKKLEMLLEENIEVETNTLETDIHEALSHWGYQAKEIMMAKTKIAPLEKPPESKEYLQEWLRLYLSHI